ncbi:hypothetical protein KAH94_01110 [bacterium]|nr:hypothetical protein [bacterium]
MNENLFDFDETSINETTTKFDAENGNPNTQKTEDATEDGKLNAMIEALMRKTTEIFSIKSPSFFYFF